MPPTYLAPGVYVEEIPGGSRPIQAVGTSTAGFVGIAPDPAAHVDRAIAVDSWTQFCQDFCPESDRTERSEAPETTQLAHAVHGFFLNGGRRCYVVNIGAEGALVGDGTKRRGLDVLEEVEEVSLVAAPGFVSAIDHEALAAHCEKLGDRVALLDVQKDLSDMRRLKEVETASARAKGKAAGGLLPRKSDGGYTASYVPWLSVRDPFDPKRLVEAAPSGFVAGICARTDGRRGVHKAPANESVVGALDVVHNITSQEQEELNPLGVNCIRLFRKEGIRLWGARTRAGSGSEWQYLNVRRLFNMIEESIAGSTRWVVFEPNDMSLWKAIRRDVGAFLLTLWRDGALLGESPEEAFFVKCDAETNPPENLDRGIVTTVVGVAPVKPAEFVVFRIGQYQAGTEVS